MKDLHRHEEVMEHFDYYGAQVDLVQWQDTIWCGKVGYAHNSTDEPDVEQIAAAAASLFPAKAPHGREEGWEVCLSLNYLSEERPNGVMFGFRVDTDRQPEGYDILLLPCAQYMRVRLCDETFQALGVEPWTGGIPPYGWIGERIAPALGYRYGDDTLPVVEYYAFSPDGNSVEACYLYVPVQKKESHDCE